MFNRPQLTIVALLHAIGIIVLASLDNRQFGERLADSLGLGTGSVFSTIGSRLLGREFSDWNLVADAPGFLMMALVMSQLGVLAIRFSFGCDTFLQRLVVAAIGSFWTVCILFLIGESFTVGEWCIESLKSTVLFLSICGIVFGFRWTAFQTHAPVRIDGRISLSQTLGLVTCLAIGLASKGYDATYAWYVLLAILTGILACLSAWSWSPKNLYRMALSAAVAVPLGIVPLLALGNNIGREGTAWLIFSLSTSVFMLASLALLGAAGRKEIGLT